MAVLKYSDLADSGLYIKTSLKGQANGVAELDSNGKVPSTQLPEGTGGTAGVSSFNTRTGAVTLVASDIPGLDASKITTGTIDAARLPAGSVGGESSAFSFKVNFSGGFVSSVDTSTLPSGWSVVSVVAPLVTIQHNVGKYPKFVSFLGYDSASSSLRYRNTTSNVDMRVPADNLNTRFAVQISSFAAQADENGYAYINISF